MVPSGLQTGWWSIELPDHRPLPTVFVTYALFSYVDLPPIREELDRGFEWLKRYPPKEYSINGSAHAADNTPDLSQLATIAAAVGLTLPEPFKVFMQSPELQARVRSCTDCYLEIGDFAVRTEGALRGYLIHFLSDSQWVLHWYIHIDDSGGESILVSEKDYGFDHEDSNGDRTIDVATQAIWYCAPTFVEFIYRFRLENEIWHALALNERPLTKIEQAYVDHYRNPASY